MKLWDCLAFVFFCAGLLFMIFGSVQAVQAWPGMLGKAIILLACGVPTVLALMVHIPDWVRARRIPVVVVVAGTVLQIGLMVTGLSRDPVSALKGMVLFLVSGVCVLLSGYLLVRTRERLQIIMHLFTACFVILCGYGIFEYHQSGLDTAHFKVNPVELFSNNPLPAGALLILLSMGPLWGWARSHNRGMRWSYVLLLIVGVGVIFLVGRKGPLIATGAMALVFGWWRIRRFPTYLALGIVLVILSFPVWGTLVSDRYLDRFKNSHSILIRMENYLFGMSVLKNNFWSGVGFNGSYKEYLPDYQTVMYIDPKVPGYPEYKKFIWEHHTLENTWFSMLAETGIVFFAAYVSLLAISMRKVIKTGWKRICANKERLAIVLPILGFVVEACTFDTLKFPNLNSVFHVSLVGFIGGIALSGTSTLPDSKLPESGSTTPRMNPPSQKNIGVSGSDWMLWLALSAAGALLVGLLSGKESPSYFSEATLLVRPNLEYGAYNLELYKTIADKESTLREIIRRLDLKSSKDTELMDVTQFKLDYNPTSFFKITNKNNGRGQLVLQAKGLEPGATKSVIQAWAEIMMEEGKRIRREVADMEINKRVVEVRVSRKKLAQALDEYESFVRSHSLVRLQNEIPAMNQMLVEARLRQNRLKNRLNKNQDFIEVAQSRLSEGIKDPEMEQYVRQKMLRADLRVKVIPAQISHFQKEIKDLENKILNMETEKSRLETEWFQLVQNLNTWKQIHKNDQINLDLRKRVFDGFPDEVQILAAPERSRSPVSSGVVSKVTMGAFLGFVLGIIISYFRKTVEVENAGYSAR